MRVRERDTTILHQAHMYARRGWAVFPVKPMSKQPLTAHGFKDATTDPAQIEKWWKLYRDANIAIATGKDSNVMVLDIDPRNKGERTFKQLIKKHDVLPETIEAVTGGGGRHIFFKYPEGVEHLAGGNNRLGPGIDVKADGGYVVVPSSIHPSGKEYRWSKGPDDVQLAVLPPWVLNQLQQKMSKQAPVVSLNREASKVLEGNRNEYLFKLGCQLKRYGLSSRAIEAALQVDNRERCQPPLPKPEVKRIAQSTDRYDPDPGAQHLIRPYRIPKEEVLDESNLLAPISLGELLARPVKPVPWIFVGFLARGRWTLLAGPPKIGKSTLTYELVVAIACAFLWLSMQALQGNILIIAVEEHEDDIIRRFREVNLHGNADKIKVVAGPLEYSKTMLAQLLAYIEANDIGVVIVDTLPKWWNVDNENDNAEIIRKGRDLLNCIRKSNAAWLTLAHTRKSGGEEGKEVRGGSALVGLVDIALSMKRCQGKQGPEGKQKRELQALSRFRETPTDLTLNYTDHGYESLGSSADFEASAKSLKVFACLSDTPQTIEELVTATKLTKHDVKNALDGLDDQVSATGQGVKGDPCRYSKSIHSKPISTGRGMDESKSKVEKKAQIIHVD